MKRRSPGITPKSDVAPRRVAATEEQKPSRKRAGNRGRTGRGLVREINRTAEQRQQAWLETGQPNVTHRLTEELDGLYGDLRDERKGDPGAAYIAAVPGGRD